MRKRKADYWADSTMKVLGWDKQTSSGWFLVGIGVVFVVWYFIANHWSKW